VLVQGRDDRYNRKGQDATCTREACVIDEFGDRQIGCVEDVAVDVQPSPASTCWGDRDSGESDRLWWRYFEAAKT
jgi:hypothetical protein